MKMSIKQFSLVTLLAMVPTFGGAAEEENQVENHGFEEVTASAEMTKRGWTLNAAGQFPLQWNLSPAFPGELQVVESAAAEGERFVRVTAPATRAAHIYQACPQIQRGKAHEVSLRYRGGSVELEMYEYDQAGKLVGEHVFVKSAGSSPANDSWQEMTGFYMLPDGVVKVSLVIVVPTGSRADVDDLRMHSFERSSEPLNVRDFGASGSSFETMAETTAGSPQVTLENVGDIEVGQEITISKCRPHFSDGLVWDETSGDRSGKFSDQVELRGYDGSAGDGAAYLLDFKGEDPPAFRWSDDLGQSWIEPLAVTGDWQKLSAGIEVKLANAEFWKAPRLVSFTARDHLLCRVVKVDGLTLTLADPVPNTANDCVVRHSDSAALQRAFDRAVGERRNVFFPSGHYRLSRGLFLNTPDGIAVEGENEEHTVLDIGGGQGACITVEGGSSVSFRRLRFRGFSGFAEMKQMAYLPAQGYPHMWGFFARHCNAITFRTPERAVVENCHATGMSAECFYSGSVSRKGGQEPPTRYTKSITYRDCTVSDCARNAFNNNDFAEGTSVLNCRVENIGGCAWEGASRFVKFSGNYVTNSGPVAMGNIRSREAHFDTLPSGQHIVSNNTFEGGLAYGKSFVAATAGATPVIISNNVFVNLNASAIEVSGFGNARGLPAGNVIISGNAIDLTCVAGESQKRSGIIASTNDTTITGNQIYTRNGIDPKVTGVMISEPAHNFVVSDNIIRGCQLGLEANRIWGSIGEIVDARTFRSNGRMPWPRRDSYRYQGYQMVWIPNYQELDKMVDGPLIDAFDPEEGVFRLKEDFDLKLNAIFVVRSPQGFAWNIHHNVISDCAQLVNLNVFGGPTAVFSSNILKRSGRPAALPAVEIQGEFKHSDNHYSGFEMSD